MLRQLAKTEANKKNTFGLSQWEEIADRQVSRSVKKIVRFSHKN